MFFFRNFCHFNSDLHRMHRFLVFSFLFWSVAFARGTCVVKTINGLIIGHQASHRSEVSEFLGIPYAKPPVGLLRFAAPQKYTTKGRFVASEFVS